MFCCNMTWSTHIQSDCHLQMCHSTKECDSCLFGQTTDFESEAQGDAMPYSRTMYCSFKESHLSSLSFFTVCFLYVMFISHKYERLHCLPD